MLKLIKIEDDYFLISIINDFDKPSLNDGDLAYHRTLKEIGVVYKFKPESGLWTFKTFETVTKRDCYKLYRVYATTSDGYSGIYKIDKLNVEMNLILNTVYSYNEIKHLL